MPTLKLYLDNCCFNRPFDDQVQLKIYLETQAKLAVQEKILIGAYELVWSYILDYENAQHPVAEIRREIASWRKQTAIVMEESATVMQKAREVMQFNVDLKDALHVACALETKADYFITTDRKLLNKLAAIEAFNAVNPIAFIEEHDL